MYSKFTTISLKEYNKIIRVIESINFEETTSDQITSYYETVYNLIGVFADNLDNRDYLLKRNIKLLHIYTDFKNRKRFQKFAYMLIEDLTNYFKVWADDVKMYYSPQPEDPNNPEDNHIVITGFQ